MFVPPGNVNRDVVSGPIIIGFDGSPAARRALSEAGALFAPRRALIVVVWEAGRAFDLAMLPVGGLELAPAPLDIRTAFEVDRAMYESACQLAVHGAALARTAGLDAEGLAVADDVSVADTLIRLAQELDGQAIVIGDHDRSRLSELLLGSTARAVVERSPCPAVVVRAERNRPDGHPGPAPTARGSSSADHGRFGEKD